MSDVELAGWDYYTSGRVLRDIERQNRQIVELLSALVKHLGADVGRRGY